MSTQEDHGPHFPPLWPGGPVLLDKLSVGKPVKSTMKAGGQSTIIMDVTTLIRGCGGSWSILATLGSQMSIVHPSLLHAEAEALCCFGFTHQLPEAVHKPNQKGLPSWWVGA